MIIGVCGKIGTGKSHVAKFLRRKLKFKHIDAEKVKLDLIQLPKFQKKIVKTFGKDILHPNGSIDRVKFIANTAQDTIRLGILSEYIDKEIGKEISKMINEKEDNYIVESCDAIRQSLTSLFDIGVLVISPKQIALGRMYRKYKPNIFENIWQWQKDIRKYDFVIENKTTIRELRSDVDQLIKEMFAQNETKV